MAKDAWSRFREREQERDEKVQKEANEILGKVTGGPVAPGTTLDSAFSELLHRGDVMIEQIQNLYNMWIAGVERMPPLNQKKQLDELVMKLGTLPKNTQAARFKMAQFTAKVVTHKDKWDRLHRDVESGKVVMRKRGGGPPGR